MNFVNVASWRAGGMRVRISIRPRARPKSMNFRRNYHPHIKREGGAHADCEFQDRLTMRAPTYSRQQTTPITKDHPCTIVENMHFAWVMHGVRLLGAGLRGLGFVCWPRSHVEATRWPKAGGWRAAGCLAISFFTLRFCGLAKKICQSSPNKRCH